MEKGSITAEHSQRDAGGPVWWWLDGDTYLHRHLLKAHGARFSGKRRQWYYLGETLPPAIAALLGPGTTDPAAEPDLEAPLLALFGGRIEAVSAAQGETVIRGANGLKARRMGWIDGDDAQRTLWAFELPAERADAHHVALKGAGARYSYASRRWYFDQADQVKAMDTLALEVAPGVTPPVMSPQLAEQIEAVLAADDAQALPSAPTEEPPAVGRTPAAPSPDKGEPVKVSSARSGSRVTPIGQAYCGELTGSITGDVHCYGYAIHDGICIYVSMGGPRMAVEAIRAKLAKGDIVSVVPDDGPAVELTPGEGKSGMYHAYMTNIPEAKFTSLILVHEWAVVPNYNGAATTFLFRTDDAQATARLKHHVTELVKVPVFDAWADYLYEAGQAAGLVRQTRGAGGIDVLTVDLDATAWTRLITRGLERALISLTEPATSLT